MRTLLFTLTVLVFVGSLAGCASDNLKAPCPHFGSSCSKVPVNSGDTHQ